MTAAPLRGSRGRIAFLWPADGRNDDEFWNYLPPGVALLTARYPVRGGLTPDDLLADADPAILGHAAGLFRHVPVDVAALGDCAGSAIAGRAGAEALAAAVTRVLHAPAVTMMAAILEALAALDAGRVALVAPYGAEVVARIEAFLVSGGVTVRHARALDAASEAGIGDRPPEAWARIAAATRRDGADAVLLAGGGIRIAAACEALEAALKTPVVAGPAALMWSACRRIGVAPTGPGRLFRVP